MTLFIDYLSLYSACLVSYINGSLGMLHFKRLSILSALKCIFGFQEHQHALVQNFTAGMPGTLALFCFLQE